MAKIRSWFNLLKKLFVSDTKGNPDKKREKKRRWVFGRLKSKRLPALAAAPLVVKERSFTEAEIDHSKQALTAAIASAVAAEAAVASAEAAVEIVRLIGTPWSYHKSNKDSRASAAIKIQTAFRGYLARKALRALKGLVRLQAMVRGQAVRRQVTTTLSGLQTLVKIQSKLHVTRKGSGEKQLVKNFDELEEKDTRYQLKSQRGSVNTLPSKEDIDALFMDRREILIKRERVKEYLFSQKEKMSNKNVKESGVHYAKRSLDFLLGHYADSQERSARVSEKSRNVEVRTGPRLGDTKYHEPFAARNSPITPPRRSFERPIRNSFEETDPFTSPIVPNYMSSTESAKARLRSVSLPKKGPGSLDVYSDHGSPSKNRPSFGSVSTDASTPVKSGRGSNSQQRSPSLKGVLGPIKSNHIAKDLSVDSDSSFFDFVKYSSMK